MGPARYQRFIVVHERRRPRRRAVLLNFVLAVGLSIALAALSTLANVANAAEIASEYGPFAVRVGAAPFVLLVVQLGLWLAVYRHGGGGARWLAGVIGVMFMSMPVVAYGRAELGLETPGWAIAAPAYLGLSHLGFAFGARS